MVAGGGTVSTSIITNGLRVGFVAELIYQYILLILVYNDSTRTMAITTFRDYRDNCLGWPREFRPAKRLVLCRFSVPLISASYMEGDYVQGTPMIVNSGDAPTIQVPLTFREEILQLHELYEDAIHRCLHLPRANQVNLLPIEMIDQIMNDWKLIGAASRTERRGLVEVCSYNNVLIIIVIILLLTHDTSYSIVVRKLLFNHQPLCVI
jgi:hypothetical protein